MCPNFSELLFPLLQNGNIYLYLCHQISLRGIIINTNLVFTAPHKCPLLGEGIAMRPQFCDPKKTLVCLALRDGVKYVTDDISLFAFASRELGTRFSACF